jgi:hypothetical protein
MRFIEVVKTGSGLESGRFMAPRHETLRALSADEIPADEQDFLRRLLSGPAGYDESAHGGHQDRSRR